MWGVEICKIYSKIMKKYHHCVKFTYPLSFQTRIPKVDQHTGGKWLIHGTKHRKDNQLQSLELSCRISNVVRGYCFNKVLFNHDEYIQPCVQSGVWIVCWSKHIKASHNWPFVRGIYLWLLERPVMRKVHVSTIYTKKRTRPSSVNDIDMTEK